MRIDYDPAAEDFLLTHGPMRARILLDDDGIQTLVQMLRAIRASTQTRHEATRPGGLTSPLAKRAIDQGLAKQYIANGGMIQQCGRGAIKQEPKGKIKLTPLEIADLLRDLDDELAADAADELWTDEEIDEFELEEEEEI